MGFTVETSYFFTKKRQVVVLAGEGDVKKKRNCPNHEIPCALTCLWKDSNGTSPPPPLFSIFTEAKDV